LSLWSRNTETIVVVLFYYNYSPLVETSSTPSREHSSAEKTENTRPPHSNVPYNCWKRNFRCNRWNFTDLYIRNKHVDRYSAVGGWRVGRRTRASHPAPWSGKTGRLTAACGRRLIWTVELWRQRWRWRSCRLDRRERQISRAPPRGRVLKMTVEASRHRSNNNNNTIKKPRDNCCCCSTSLRPPSLGREILITAITINAYTPSNLITVISIRCRNVVRFSCSSCKHLPTCKCYLYYWAP